MGRSMILHSTYRWAALGDGNADILVGTNALVAISAQHVKCGMCKCSL